MNTPNSFKDLKKSNRDCKIAGVCGGFGEYTSIPSWAWRAVFLFSLFLGGLGFIAYIILWICMPSADTRPQSNFQASEPFQKEI